MKELQANFKYSFGDLKSLKSTFAFFVNPFICDIIEDGFPFSKIILGEKAAGELELLEMKETISHCEWQPRLTYYTKYLL